MARHENDPLDINIPDPPSFDYIYLTKGGEKTTKDDPKAYTMKVTNSNFPQSKYFVKFGRGVIFDPWGMYAGRETSRDFDFVKVSQDVYNYYCQYLTTRNKSFLSLAERKMIDV